jgi:two-component system cell cycle sensor histidine kinase/response regulator CckA
MKQESLKILMIEDSLTDAEAVREALLGSGVGGLDLDCVGRLDEALDRLNEEQFDIIILDLFLPDEQGIQSLRRLREAAPEIPVVVLTGVDDEALAAEVVREGAQDYIVKGTVAAVALIRSLRHAMERKSTERSLRKAEEKYRGIFENAVEGIFQTTRAGRFLVANPAMARILGYDSPQELIDSITDIGKQVYVDPGERARLMSELGASPRESVFDLQFYRKDGKKIWVRSSMRTVPGPDPEPFHYEGIVEDTTDRKLLEQQLHQAQKMEAIGRLAGGLAHDFNNLLTAILGYGQLTLANMSPTDPSRRYVEEITRAGERAATLTNHLLAFSRKQVFKPQILDLNHVITEIEKMLRRLIGEDVDLVTRLCGDLWRVRADRGQIEQVIMNMAVNARDAMPQGGDLTINTGNELLDERHPCCQIGLKPGPYVILSVTDTGCGIDAETISHIFEPFFTTKDQTKGTGLGLSTAYAVISQSGGYIWVESEPGSGTCFKIYLPKVDDPAESLGSPSSDESVPTGIETLLLAEDDPMVRELADTVLRDRGYTVLAAESAAEACILSDSFRGEIHLLLTDVVMPRTGGRELAERIRTRRPHIKVLYYSGYTGDTIANRGMLDPGVSFLEKPFTRSSLAKRVREVLDSPG